MRKGRVQIIALGLVVCFLLVGCAGIQEKWGALTPDEKSRVIINDLQERLNIAFDTGKAFVASNPQHQVFWKTKIVPAFDVANKSLASASKLAMSGDITPDQVYAEVQPVFNAVINLLVSIGAVKKSEVLPEKLIFPGKPLQAALDSVFILAIINGLVSLAMQLWSSARKVFGSEAIPSWEEIISKNKALQDKIDAEIQNNGT